MDQDITVRLANEGVPVRAIARATRLPSADVRTQLKEAQSRGLLIEIPCEDWSTKIPPTRRPLQPRQITDNLIRFAVRKLFRPPPLEVTLLLLLLQHNEVDHGQIYTETASRAPSPDSNSLAVNMSRLRRRLRSASLRIESIYGHGYRMPIEHRRQLLTMIRGVIASTPKQTTIKLTSTPLP